MSERTQTIIFDRRSGKYVPATLIDGVSEIEVAAAERAWRPVINEALLRMEAEGVPPHERPQHSHWDWREKHRKTHDMLAFQMFGLECDGDMQGLMLVQTEMKYCKIPNQKGKPLVYVYFIASAPWNSTLYVAEPRYSQVGRILLAAAIQLSQDLEFAGRIGLHSLPQTESYYADKCRMTDLGRDPDPNTQHLKYFEMTPEQASNFFA